MWRDELSRAPGAGCARGPRGAALRAIEHHSLRRLSTPDSTTPRSPAVGRPLPHVTNHVRTIATLVDLSPSLRFSPALALAAALACGRPTCRARSGRRSIESASATPARWRSTRAGSPPTSTMMEPGITRCTSRPPGRRHSRSSWRSSVRSPRVRPHHPRPGELRRHSAASPPPYAAITCLTPPPPRCTWRAVGSSSGPLRQRPSALQARRRALVRWTLRRVSDPLQGC